TSSANPSAFGQAVTFTATVSAVAPGVGVPTGSVDFFDVTTNTDLGTGTLKPDGTATVTAGGLAFGPHTVTATYGTTTNFNQSTSPDLTQTVLYGSTTTVSSSDNPSVYGQTI